MKDKIEMIIRKYLMDSNCVLDDKTRIIDDLGFDSITLIAFITDLEESFDITFSAEELDYENCNVYSNIVKMVNEKILSE